ncbi:hypothetical protein E2C01_049525 [Portunus trituberculatus]|jgi:hypothetical protein
MVVG